MRKRQCKRRVSNIPSAVLAGCLKDHITIHRFVSTLRSGGLFRDPDGIRDGMPDRDAQDQSREV